MRPSMKSTTHRLPFILHFISGNRYVEFVGVCFANLTQLQHSPSSKEISTYKWFTPLPKLLRLRFTRHFTNIMLLNIIRLCFPSRQSVSANKYVRIFFNLSKVPEVNISLTYAVINIALWPFLSARRYWPGTPHPFTTSCVPGCFSSPDCSAQCVHTSTAIAPCLPRCTSTLVGQTRPCLSP